MLKLKKSDASAEAPLGIATQGDAIRRLWVITLLMFLLPLLCGSAYLLLLREAQLGGEKVEQVSQLLAEQQAARVQQLFDDVKRRMAAAAVSPLALSVLTSDNPDDLLLIEKTLLDYFPGAISARLVPVGALGTATLEASNLGLRNHIELDLLRTASAGEATAPESYEFDGNWLTSMAVQVHHPQVDHKRALIMLTYDAAPIASALSSEVDSLGRSSLQQIYRKGNFSRTAEVATAGSGNVSEFEVNHPLNGGKWQLAFTPSQEMVNRLTPDSIPLMGTLGLILLSGLVALAFLLIKLRQLLNREVEHICTTAEKRAPMVLAVPELLPLARALNRATMRQTLAGREASAAGKTPIKRPAEGGLTDPMFQKHGMIVEDSADSFAEHDEDSTQAPQQGGDETSELPSHIFRAYDIRGIADTELTDDLISRVGGAIGTRAGNADQQAVLVGCDGRNSSPRIKSALIKALISSGRDVVDLGLVTTPLLYFATHTRETRTGVMVTGSHNPADYNGLKIVVDGVTLAGDEIQALKQQVLEGNFSTGAGKLVKYDIRPDYLNTIMGDMAIAESLKIVVDAGNGVAGLVAPDLLELLGCEVVPLYCDVDGDFPNHHPDPSDEDNLAELCQRVVAEGADLGLAFDGDGDRLAVVTAQGDIVRTDKLMMLYAQDVVSRNPGADVVFDVKCSRHLGQVVSQYGGRPVLWKTGHSFMREKIRETGALLGGEFSGHIFFSERWYGFDDGIYAAARLAELLGTSAIGLTELLEEFPQTVSTPEILIPVGETEKFKLIQKLSEDGDFSPGKVNLLDGVRVDYADCWGLLRASNTVPALTARFEGDSEEAMQRVMQQFREQLVEIEPALNGVF